MDGFSGKRAVDGLVVPRKGCGRVPRENANNRDKSLPVSSINGHSARINSTKGTMVGSIDKTKSYRPSLGSSSNGKEIVGSSTRTLAGAGNSRRPYKGTCGRQQPSSQLDKDSSEPHASPGKAKRRISTHSENIDAREAVSMEAGGTGMVPRRGSHRSFRQTQDVLAGSSIVLSSGSSSQAKTRGNLGSSTRKKEFFKKRNSDVESSSSNRGKKITKPVVEGRNQNSTHGLSISGTRRNRNSPTSRETSVFSVSARRPTGYYGRSSRHFGAGVSPAAVIQSPQPNPSLSAENNTSPSNSHSRPGSRSGMTPRSSSELGATHALMNRDIFRHYDMDGMAEVLLGMERIEQHEVLTYEQLLVLETNLLLSGISLYDQHRDMRLDIDNMSYEELLALEEMMGTVSTALSEEALSKSLKTSIYQWSSRNEDDVKCSICQEEYVEGDQVGSLHCDHRYHVGCIRRWLRMKNWCPICKTCAQPSP